MTIVSWLVDLLQRADVDVFLSNLVGTLIGVLVAFVLALRYDNRKQNSRDRETSLKTVNALNKELSENLKDLEDVKLAKAVAKMWVFRTGAYESAVSTGNISLLSMPLQSSLAYLYMNFKIVETAAAKMFSMLGTATAFQDWTTKFEPEVERLMLSREEILRRDIPEKIKLLEQEKTQLVGSKGSSDRLPRAIFRRRHSQR